MPVDKKLGPCSAFGSAKTLTLTNFSPAVVRQQPYYLCIRSVLEGHGGRGWKTRCVSSTW